MHEPGSAPLYTTGTYTVIAAAIEAAMDQSFVEVMQEEVLTPAEMKDTVPNDPRVDMPERTRFYEAKGDGVEAVVYDPSYKCAGAGYVATASDLARFGSALLNEGFLSAELREELFRDHETDEGELTGFGLGWRITRDDQEREVLIQPGGGPGISSYLVIYPEEAVVLAALSNHTRGPTWDRIMDETLEAFLEAAADLEAAAGRY